MKVIGVAVFSFKPGGRGQLVGSATGHRDVTSCEARDFVQFRKWRW